MWRRLIREDLSSSNPLLGGNERHGHLRWRVYEQYEFSQLENGDYFVHVADRGTERQASVVDSYEPITDTPHLFLEFARLVESKSSGDALYDWIHKYGLLGLSPRLTSHDALSLAQASPDLYNDDRGGSLDNLENIWALAWEANESLLLYEAATGGDQEKLEQVLFLDEDPDWVKDRRQRLEYRAEITGAGWVQTLVNAALFQLLEYAHGPLITSCYPVVSYPPRFSHMPDQDAPPMRPDDLSRGWGARNLWGAMGLQFYWLITSGGQLDHCRYCGRVIPHAPPVPGSRPLKSRKVRSDKTFCDSRCRQNYHYHSRMKHGRRSGTGNGTAT